METAQDDVIFTIARYQASPQGMARQITRAGICFLGSIGDRAWELLDRVMSPSEEVPIYPGVLQRLLNTLK